MTERSYVWTHGIGGDAVDSPYNATEFNFYHFIPLVGEGSDTAYVVPGYLNDLEVQSPGNDLAMPSFMGVIVQPGAAILNQYLYVLDTPQTLFVRKTDLGYVRRDIVVLRYTNIDNKPKIRLGIVEGVDSSSTVGAATPTLTQNATTFEVALAVILVGSVNWILGNNIEDRRRFIHNTYCKRTFGGFRGNLIQNSEFLGNSYEGTVSQGPDHWIPLGTTFNTRTAMPVGSGRGNLGYNLDVGAAQLVSIKQYIPAGRYRTFTLSGYVNKGSPLDSLSITINAYKSPQEFIKQKTMSITYNVAAEAAQYFQKTFTFDEEYIDILEVSFVSTFADATLVQPILVPGYHPGNYRPISETLMFQRGIPDASWTATAKSTGSTLINLTASFGGIIPLYTRAVILRLRARDSGSAGAPCYLAAYDYTGTTPYGTTRLDGVTNDVWRETHCIVPVDSIYWKTGVAGAQFQLTVVATGALTLDATVEIVGIII